MNYTKPKLRRLKEVNSFLCYEGSAASADGCINGGLEHLLKDCLAGGDARDWVDSNCLTGTVVSHCCASGTDPDFPLPMCYNGSGDN